MLGMRFFINWLTYNVIPAKAGIQGLSKLLDSRLRGNDK